MSEPTITGIAVDLDTNTLHVQLETGQSRVTDAISSRCRGTIDIGAGGKLVGVEVGERYVGVMEPDAGTESLIRSADSQLDVVTRAATGEIVEIVIPRRGAEYEITWPSGNQ